MAATPVPIVKITPNGPGASQQMQCDPVNGNVVSNTRGLHLVFANYTTQAREITFVTTATVEGYDVEDHTVEIAAGVDDGGSITPGTLVLGGFSERVFGRNLRFQTDSDQVWVEAYSV